jgi:hypothetical protein
MEAEQRTSLLDKLQEVIMILLIQMKLNGHLGNLRASQPGPYTDLSLARV